MQKRRFYFILTILTIVSLFSFAAICSQCGADTEEKVDIGEDEASEDKNPTASEEEEEVGNEDNTGSDDETDEADSEEEADSDTDDDTDAATDTDSVKEVPTISLEIYEGPFPVESICVYRVKAVVTGSPAPSVSWSKDDSEGSWGTKKAQVNLISPSDTYTLTATATNSEGSATDFIDLSWGCAVEEVVEDEEEDGEEETPEDLNHPPVVYDIIIEGPKASILGSTVYTNKKYNLFVEVVDEDVPEGDILSYNWYLQGSLPHVFGTISDPSSNPTTWITPSDPNDNIEINIEVTDRTGASVLYEKSVKVVRDLGH